ncbi:MAG: hypothetical protein GF370_02835 [Candidatus Nealsonbacteria bacterium]|nr:hypothetical protein [Candidatus Nealsonbacteria bacterium]
MNNLNQIEKRSRIGEVKKDFKVRTDFILAGRVIAKRSFSKILFLDLKDQSGIIQIIFERSESGLKILNEGQEIALGDIILVKGETYLTKRNEQSLLIKDFLILNKNRDPYFFGFKRAKRSNLYEDKYKELAVDQEKFRYYINCSSLKFGIRKALFDRGFLEFDTGILQSRLEGGFAHPFKTYCRSLDRNLYLRMTGEIKLKQLLASGYEKIFEMGKIFRNEGFSFKSSPEFTLLDCYWALSNYHKMMELFESIIKETVSDTFGKIEFRTSNGIINLAQCWRRVSFEKIAKEILGEDLSFLEDENKIRYTLLQKGVKNFTSETKEQMVRKLIGKIVIPKIITPTYITDVPAIALPLAKVSPENKKLSEGAFLVIDGLFVGDTYNDENDPGVMKEKLISQTKNTGKPLNDHFLDLLEFGIPPSAGFGLGINQLLLLFRGNIQSDIRKTSICSPLN